MSNYLEYGKVSLRNIEPEDIDLLYNWENNTEIWAISNTKVPFSKHILTQYIIEAAKDIYETRQLRLIIQNLDSKPVGAIDLFDFDPYHMRAGVGVLIHSNSDKNKGYATDALEALSRYTAKILGLKQLYANIAGDNINSIRLFEKAGFTRVGVKKEWLRTLTGWKDEIMFQKLLV